MIDNNRIESQTTEFKQIWKDDYLKTICATLSQEVPIEKFDKAHQSRPFNPILANIFYKAGFIENWGRGTLNVIDECLAYGLPKPTYENDWGAVKVTFYKKQEHKTDDVGTNVGIKELYEFIEIYQPTRVSMIKEHFDNITTRTLERWIKKLKDENKIEYKGSKRTGGYFVK